MKKQSLNHNIAFEISPLLLASGKFGDKSGVYRYIYGLIMAMEKKISEKNDHSKIILFSFNRNLLSQPLNIDIIDLIGKERIILLNKFSEFCDEPKLGSFAQELISELLIIKQLAKLLNKLFNIKNIYNILREKVHFQTYLDYLDAEFKKSNVKTIFHSQTRFYPMKGYKNIATIYDLTPILFPTFHRSETLELHRRKFVFAKRYCQGIICISQSTKNDLLNYCSSFKKKNIVIAYPGFDKISKSLINKKTELFNDIKMLLKKKSQTLVINKYLLYFGTFEPRKNIINLVKSFVDLQEENEIPLDFKLVLIGGDGWGNIKKMISDYIKENFPIEKKCNIIMFDFLADKYLISLISNAYATVYPSLYEGFGLPILESMALGTPVICSDNSSLPEVGGNAVLYTKNNFLDLKNKIKYLINNPELAIKLSQKGLAQSKKFTWSTTASKVYNFLLNI
ncbi:MAG: glycosyltransferase family 1 protein [Patescibacteria group bacterium]